MELNPSSKPSGRSRRLAPTAVALVSLIAPGIAVGLFAGMAISVGEMAWLGSQVYWTGLFTAFAVLLTLLLFAYVAYRLTMRIIGPRARQASLYLYAWLARHRSSGLFSDGARATWRRSISPRLSRLLPVVATYVAYVGPAALIVALLTNLVLIANLGVGRLQADRLQNQNILIEAQSALLVNQNVIAALAQQAQNQGQEAERRFAEITRILDERKSVATQEYALTTLPDTMVMTVERVNPQWVEWKGRTAGKTAQQIGDLEAEIRDEPPQTWTEYPNLRPLAQRLQTYMREASIPSTSSDENDDSSLIIGAAIIRALHRLGYGNEDDLKFGECVWDAVFNEDGAIPQAHEAGQGVASVLNRFDFRPEKLPKPTSQQARYVQPSLASLLRNDDPGVSGLYDLRHFGRALHRVRLPRLHLRNVRLHGANMEWAELPAANMAYSELHGANMRSARLLCANMTQAKGYRANMRGAELSGADLGGARFWGTDLSEASLNGANMFTADLQGAFLRNAAFVGARMIGVNLQFAELNGAMLYGANMSHADLRVSDMRHAQLRGVVIDGAKLHGADLRYAEFGARRVPLLKEGWNGKHGGGPVMKMTAKRLMCNCQLH